MRRRRLQLVGVAFLAVLGLLGWLTVAVYQKQFETTVPVTVRTDHAGNQLQVNADVKVRGVVVGRVSQVRTRGSGAELTLALDPDHLDRLPHNVSARLLPKTLFGQRYVSLVLPELPERRMAAGDVIDQDRTSNAIELEKVLRDLMPLLQAVEPHKLASALGSLAKALEGRGRPLGESMVSFNRYLRELNPSLPQLQASITGLADVAGIYDKAAPDFVQALSDFTVTSKTLAEQRANLTSMVTNLTTSSVDLTAFFEANRKNFIALTEASRPTLELLARYAPEYPCLLEAVNKVKPLLEKAFGAGTGEPGLHVELTVKQPKGKYLPGKDDPAYRARGGPRCYPTAGGAVSTADGLGLPNSPEENRFITELLAPAVGVEPAALPGWSSLLVGPLLRGTEVTVR